MAENEAAHDDVNGATDNGMRQDVELEAIGGLFTASRSGADGQYYDWGTAQGEPSTIGGLVRIRGE